MWLKGKKFGEKGQTSVEYILMVAILTLAIISLTGKLKVFLLSDNGECANPETNKSYICQVFAKGILSPELGYRTFKLMRFNR